MVHQHDESTANEVSTTTQLPSYGSSEEPRVYKVGCPPQKNFAREFRDTLRETFFHDNPLRQYKDQSGSAKFRMALQFLFPIFEWGRCYNLRKFKGDLIAGLTIASLCIPQVSTGTSLPMILLVLKTVPDIDCFYSNRISGIRSLLTWMHNMDYVSSPITAVVVL